MIPSASQESLFLPDIFCDVQPRYAAVTDPSFLENIRIILSDFYGIRSEDVERLESPAATPINSRIARFESGGQRLILKSVPLDGPPDSLDRYVERMRFIDSLRRIEGVLFPEILPQLDRSLVRVRDGRAYYLMKRADDAARHLGEDEGDLRAAAESIGNMIAVLRKKGPDSPVRERDYFTGPEEETFERLRRVAAEDRGDRPFKQYWPVFYDQYQKSNRDYVAQGWNRIRPEWTHIDIHPHNLLLKDSRVACFLDVESVLPANRVACLGFAVFKILRNQAALAGYSEAESGRLRDMFIAALVDRGALDVHEIRLLSLGARVENLKRFLHGFLGQRGDAFQSGQRLPIFGRALSGEIDAIFGSLTSQ